MKTLRTVIRIDRTRYEWVGGLKHKSQEGFQTKPARIHLFNFLFKAERSGGGRGVGRVGCGGNENSSLH